MKRFLFIFVVLFFASLYLLLYINQKRKIITIYSSVPEESINYFIINFMEKTGVNVNVVYGVNNDIIQSLLKNEGNVDIFISNDHTMMSLLEKRNILHDISKKMKKYIDVEGLDSQKFWLPIGKKSLIFAYNKESNISFAVENYEDLSDIRLYNNIVMSKSVFSDMHSLIAYIIMKHGVEYAKIWISGFNGNVGDEIVDDDVIYSALKSKNRLLVLYTNTLAKAIKKDPTIFDDVKIIVPNQKMDGAYFNISCAGILRQSHNKKKSLLFLSYILSNDSQNKNMLLNMEFPVAKNIELPLELQIFGAFKNSEDVKNSLMYHIKDALLISKNIN